MIRLAICFICLNLLGPTWAETTASRDSVASFNAKISAQKFSLKMIAPAGTHFNYAGPWKLTLADGLPAKKHTFGLESVNQSLHLFDIALDSSPNAKTDKSYSLVYFLCSDDNVWCKRVETKGSAE